MSRKTIMTVIGVLETLLVFLKEQFGLAIDVTAVVGGLGAILVYVLLEAKLDFKRIKAQPGRFSDKKFLLALASTILVAVQSSFGLNLPVEAIVSVLTVVMGFLFGREFKEASKEFKKVVR